MGYPTKIATCCHCGTKAVLKLDRRRHELSCASCGAPLRDLKLIPVSKAVQPKTNRPSRVRNFPEKPKAVGDKKTKPRKIKKRKNWFKDMAEDVFDFVEDIFD